MEVIEKLEGSIIVSCQAKVGEPLDKPEVLAALAEAAEKGGAMGIRANWPRNIKKIKKRIDIPIIGIYKKEYNNSKVYITPTFKEAKEIIDIGVEILALDATRRSRPDNKNLKELVWQIRNYSSDVLLMADIATYEEAVFADDLGFDLIATTLLSYTEETKNHEAPDMNLVAKISSALDTPVIVEGKVHTAEQAASAVENGAYAVVIGTAITNIRWVTEYYRKAIQSAESLE